MSSIYANKVASVARPPLLVMLCREDQGGWCQQLSEEGYQVIHVAYCAESVSGETLAQDVVNTISTYEGPNKSWGLLTFGIDAEASRILSEYLIKFSVFQDLKACVHFCPIGDTGDPFIFRKRDNTIVPTVIHLATQQEELHASILPLILDPGYDMPTEEFNPIAVHTYPRVSASPPFPYLSLPPALQSHNKSTTGTSVDPYLRSATGLSYTRTLALLKRYLGPHYDLEKLWEKHTYYEFAERDAMKTMATMVATPYVNHIATMTGGLGHDDLARFYKYHFTKENVTPPDTELITISRTVGADRIIDEMIFKCTHTTENDYFLPGIKPTGKPLELAVVGVVAFRGDKLTFEHIYWDQASALVQLGLLDAGGLPVAGVEVARKVVDPFGLPSNTLMAKWKESEGLPL